LETSAIYFGPVLSNEKRGVLNYRAFLFKWLYNILGWGMVLWAAMEPDVSPTNQEKFNAKKICNINT
jgi:hypothetical protein